MMKLIAVICEYNPFHNGHYYQIEQIKAHFPDCAILALMSGNYVQRGSLAILPKYERAKAAVLNGVNLVLELPYPYSGSTAEYFASGAIRLLERIHSVDFLCFGSESGDLSKLQQMATRLLSDDFQVELHKQQQMYKTTPLSFPKIKSRVYEMLYGESLPNTPNDILGIEYSKALQQYGSNIMPFPVKRKEADSHVTSATELRRRIAQKEWDFLQQYVPESAYSIYMENRERGNFPVDLQQVGDALLLYFRLTPPESFQSCADVTDGMEYRLYRNANQATDFPTFFQMCCTKKYTHSKIRRMVLNCVFGTTEAQCKAEPLFTQVLSADAKGLEILHQIKSKTEVIILTKSAHYQRYSDEIVAQFEQCAKADKLYTLALPQKMPSATNILQNPYIFP